MAQQHEQAPEPTDDPVDAWHRRWKPEHRPAPAMPAPPTGGGSRSIWAIIGPIAGVVACVGCCLIPWALDTYLRESLNPLDVNIEYANDTTRPLVVAKCWWKTCDDLLEPFAVPAGKTVPDRGFRPWWLVVAEADGRVAGCVDVGDDRGPVELSRTVGCPADFGIPDRLPTPAASRDP